MSYSTWDTSRLSWDFAYGAITLFGRPFQTARLFLKIPYQGPATPSSKLEGLGSSAFARRY